MLKKHRMVNKSKKGFTLVEIIVTVAVLGIVASVSLGVLWAAMNTHTTLSTVSINSQISSNTMHNIHRAASKTSSVELINTTSGGDNLQYLNLHYSGAEDGSTAIYAQEVNGKLVLHLALKKSGVWNFYSQFEEGVDKAEFYVDTTTLTGANGEDNVKLNYSFYSEKSMIYTTGVVMENIKTINNAVLGSETVPIVYDLVNDPGADNKIILLEL